MFDPRTSTSLTQRQQSHETLEAGSRAGSGDRAIARRTALEAAGNGKPLRAGAVNAAGAQRRSKSAAPLPAGEARGRGGKAPAQGGDSRPSLDRLASYPSPSIVGQPAHYGAASTRPPHRDDDSLHGKVARHRQRRAAARALPSERVCTCGQNAIGRSVLLHKRDGQAHYSGVETCGSVWHCPVCAAKITEARKAEVEAVLRAHLAAGGLARMATLTIPHRPFQRCKDLRQAVTKAWGCVKAGQTWRRNRDHVGWLGDVRALEITHGSNGWHPHLHVLILIEPGATDEVIAEFGEWLFDRWAKAIWKLGFGDCARSAFTFEPVSDEGAAEYVGKWGAALELTKGHIKQGRGGRTPWQILADLAAFNRYEDRRLFREYGRSFKGARQLVWSQAFKRLDGRSEPSIRGRYLADPELDDDELAVDDASPDTVVAIIDRDVFEEVASSGRTAELLCALENHGLAGVLDLLSELGVAYDVGQGPSETRGQFVPWITCNRPPGPDRPPSWRRPPPFHQSQETGYEYKHH